MVLKRKFFAAAYHKYVCESAGNVRTFLLRGMKICSAAKA